VKIVLSPEHFEAYRRWYLSLPHAERMQIAAGERPTFAAPSCEGVCRWDSDGVCMYCGAERPAPTETPGRTGMVRGEIPRQFSWSHETPVSAHAPRLGESPTDRGLSTKGER
jgi:hypothetical protein